MPKLIIQRSDRSNYFGVFKVYINRSAAGEIPFAERLELDLPAGRYQINVGSFRAKEASHFTNLERNHRAFEISTEKVSAFKNWPKNQQTVLIEKGPVQLANQKERKKFKKEYRNTLLLLALFNGLFLTLLAWPLHRAWHIGDGLAWAAVLIGLLILWQINNGVKRFFLRKEKQP
jgi:Fe-S cluster biosynthesis and repair protein YggX